MADESVLLVSPSVDWITCTYKSSPSRFKVKSLADSLIELEISAGNRIKQGSFNGYKCYMCGGILYGDRADGYLVRLSGLTAAKHYRLFGDLASNVTRLDIAATVKLSEHGGGLIASTYETTRAGLDEQAARRYTLIQNSKGGDTMYVGSRTSSQYGRIYDKWAESGKLSQWLNCIRYEIEFKKPLSLLAYNELAKTDNPNTWISTYLRQWFLTRGVGVVYNSSATIRALQLTRDRSDNETKLMWLSKSVHPAYVQLKLAGLEDVALEAIRDGAYKKKSEDTDHYTKEF